ncbi:MAG: sulfotransferase domain-containing protein [Flavobacteriales bacterium]|nr:sulfotransferase domain-containing protein [Flavobacteriales bacterium]
MLPNFICVGAQKAGSSSLYKLLKSHPELHVSEQKEIHYYNIEENYNKGLDYYKSFFNEGYQEQKLIGEFTPDYLQYTFVPDRINKDLGNIKIIIILRHPVTRAYSQFNFHKMNKHEEMDSDFESCMRDEELTLGIKSREEWYYPAYYRSKSMYFEQVKRYVEVFGKENVQLVVFEEMIKDRQNPNLIETCRFLGVNDQHKFVSNHSNPTILNFNTGYIKTLRAFKDFLLKVVPEKIMRPITDKVIQQTYQKPQKLDKQLKDKLYNEYFLNDVKKLEEYYGIDLSIWNA